MAVIAPFTNTLSLHSLEIELAQMAALVETNLVNVISALERRDVAGAAAIIPTDKRIDAYHSTIEMAVYKLLEHERPTAKQIREMMTIIKISADLERVGDLAKNIARRLCIINQDLAGPSHNGLARMGRMSLQQLSDVLNAYSAQDLTAARAVWIGDNEVDELYYSVFRELTLAMKENTDRVKDTTHMVFIAKNFERVGDHATNIAEALHFSLTGDQLNDERVKSEEKSGSFTVPDKQG